MSQNLLSKEEYLDAKTIPKFQFELIDEELINCIKQLYVQSKNQQKIVALHKKQLVEKLNITSFTQSFTQIQNSLKFPKDLQALIPSTLKNKTYNDPTNPIMTKTVLLSNKFSIFNEILSILNSKIINLQKRFSQSEQTTNKNVKQKISSVEEQLTTFVKDYRLNFKDLDNKFEQTKINFNNKAKQIQTNTLWKINQCTKRLEDRPNVQMVRNSISQFEMKLTKKFQSGSNSGKVGSNYTDTTKLQQDVLKLQKLVNFNSIQTQTQIKSFTNKLQTSFMTLKSFADQKIQIMKKIEYVNIVNSDIMRKLKSIETQNNQRKDDDKKTFNDLQNHTGRLKKIEQKVQKFTKNDEIAKILQKIDPHQICRLTGIVKQLQEKNISFQNQFKYFNSYIQTLRSKMQFWNVANSNPQKSDQQNLNVELITKIIKDEINNSDFKTKLMKFQTQIIDLTSLKEGVNDILKKLNKINKDNDLTSLKYQIQGVQEYLKRQILLVNNRVNSFESSINNLSDSKKRPLSATRRSGDDGKLFTSVSTKKLLPVSCLSCHQSNTILAERRTVYRSKLPQK